ncbi:MAG: HigA family addiction module antitoxin [Reichenbachiella sp.]|uniref:HigA family addiction module antitoxin n=1 Tax=Reichenbachiella sp. TaxID=2184521 RepID=UPI003265AF1C
MEKLMNIHPGEILEKDFLEPMNITAYKLSKEIGVQQTRISQIIKGNTAITADMATRLSKFFGTSAELWMNLQSKYEIRKTRAEKQDVLNKIRPMVSATENL